MASSRYRLTETGVRMGRLGPTLYSCSYGIGYGSNMWTRDTNLAVFPNALLLLSVRAVDVNVVLHVYPRTRGEPFK